MKTINFILLIFFSSLNSTHAQKLTSENTNEFALSKLDYVDACQALYARTEETCDCSFEYMRNNYKVRFYQDDAFLNQQHQQRSKLIEKITESLQLCTSDERDEFAYPRQFESL